MNGRAPRLPPLNALRAFWAVMRRGSFRAAADELLVTPQAISQQIRLLEETLNLRLFTRRGRAIEPTEEAQILSRFVAAGFDEFSEGIRRVTQTAQRSRININVSPYFATRFLLERLESFRRQMPGADLRLTTMVELPDFDRDDIDVAIQWGFGDWAGLDAQLLVRDPKIICCAPDLAPELTGPEDLSAQTLLHPVRALSLWDRVFAHLGLDSDGITGALQLQDAATMRRATISGMGVGLISRRDAAEDLAAGRLVAPLGADVLAGMAPKDVPGFYLLLPRAHRRIEIIRRFCDWISAENWDALI
ncbi:LysR substrate-binding domain-containing protein [Paracoccus sediminicola]|uniref:LysR substrate-binding domain-containing protein n=1 Tax=Paracoccus sediminicola TaxID=3017783 RepID=UPI0022F071A4|nr:LysR substrate-binding domain-containing protein [Paracoccus sediminicola]WBU57258.1 LysR substrate-binding domain-containing protein [Paracoccus sediminicola]